MKVTGREIDDSNNKISFHIVFAPYYSRSEFRIELVPVDNTNSTILKKFDLKNHDKKGLEYTFTLIPSKTLTYDNSKMRLRVLERVREKRMLFGEAEIFLSDVLSNGMLKTRVKKNGNYVGEVRVKEVKRPTRFTFLNYVDAGAEISLIIAMDFTKSNKEPTNPKSLHYCMNGIQLI